MEIGVTSDVDAFKFEENIVLLRVSNYGMIRFFLNFTNFPFTDCKDVVKLI